MPVWRPDGYNTDEALHVYDMVNASPFDAFDDACALHVMEVWERFDEAVDPYITAVRKDNPVAALFHGLGPQRARVLPGWAGDAVLTAAEVRDRLEAVESVLALSGAEREQVLSASSTGRGTRIPPMSSTTRCGSGDRPLEQAWSCCPRASGSDRGLLSAL
ncbi:hypothetical protein [Streptomyces sp. NPDC046759]|uniref:hypothetical protein n=1 Tax=Streptomyces sp. NPDC046759 TaxID=3155019 RepID=UPI00340E24CC